jgi:tRNA modification GTPase
MSGSGFVSEDTIVALSTPPGRGAISTIRFSGPDSLKIARRLVRLPAEPTPRRAFLGEFYDANGEVVDQVILTWFRAPNSYTGEDVVEVSCHGAPVVVDYFLRCALVHDARLAEPGEFTMRAFLHGRLNLAQAEAVQDLIQAQTIYQAKVAVQQMEGALSRRLSPVKQELVDLIALLEAGIDFAEDDISVAPPEEIVRRMELVRGPLAEWAGSFRFGRVVREGLTLAILGRPNVGKSSLFNRLLERERAIVTASAGTTRDLVSETLNLEGIPVRLVDTAGIRDTADEAESIGVRRSFEASAEADLTLLVLDATQGLTDADRALIARFPGAILVVNKTDAGDHFPAEPHERCSALTGQGIPELRRALWNRLSEGGAEPGFLTNVRHERLIRDALAALERAFHAVETGVPHEMLLLDLYNVLQPLGAITGETTIDDILNRIFSTFCIGK